MIDIPNWLYNAILENKEPIYSQSLGEAVRDGTPLPKGHGRIADMDEAIKCIKEIEGEDAVWAIGLIEWACGKRTIIEADKAERNEEENVCLPT